MKIVFEDEFEQYLFARWADYLEVMELDESRLDLFEFEEQHKAQIFLFYKLSKINFEKSKQDFQQWLSKLNIKQTIH